MSLIPTRGRVIALRDKTEEVTEGGIVLPDQAQKKSTFGTVVAIPFDAEDDTEFLYPIVGTRILFGKYGGTDIQLEGQDEFVILPVGDVLATFKGNGKEGSDASEATQST